jgi:hypothetical protein
MSTSTAPLPPKRPPGPPPPPSKTVPGGVASGPKRSFAFKDSLAIDAQKTIIYGPGGIGKSKLHSLLMLQGLRTGVLDIGTSCGFLKVNAVDDILTWQDLRGALNDDSLWDGIQAIVIDDLTKAEELAGQWVIQNVKHEKGKPIHSIEDYGFGKGLTHIYETFLTLLSDLDRHVRAGRHVVCIAHECTANVPNPGGEDWIRYEPRLQSPASGKSSIRHRVKEWCDHLLFIGYDTAVNEDGKATGAGSRTIYPQEMPTHWAKSRSLSEPIVYADGSPELWVKLFSKGE